MENLNTHSSRLEFYALLYLGIPFLFYSICWFKPIVVSAIFLLLLMFFIKNPMFVKEIKIKKNDIIEFSIITLILIFFGFGEIVLPQAGDWQKHNAIFSTIFNAGFNPVELEYKGQQYLLSYGTGFYYGPSIIARLFNSYEFLPILILINSAIGLKLIFNQINAIFPIKIRYIILALLMTRLLWMPALLKLNYYEWLEHFKKVDYNDIVIVLISFVVQHIIPICIVGLAIVKSILNEEINWPYLIILTAFGIYWSPFVLIPVAPLFLTLFIFHYQKIDKEIILQSIAPSIILLFIVSLSNNHLPFSKSHYLTEASLNLYGYVRLIFFNYFWIYCLFWPFFIYQFRKGKIPKRIFVMLTIVPFFAVGFVPFDFGYFSDLSTKSMIFPVVMCNLFFISYFIKFPPDKKVYKIYYILIIVLTLISPVRNLTYRINEIAKDEKEVDTRFLLKENKNITLNEVFQEASISLNHEFVKQYLGYKSKYMKLITKD